MHLLDTPLVRTYWIHSYHDTGYTYCMGILDTWAHDTSGLVCTKRIHRFFIDLEPALILGFERLLKIVIDRDKGSCIVGIVQTNTYPQLHTLMNTQKKLSFTAALKGAKQLPISQGWDMMEENGFPMMDSGVDAKGKEWAKFEHPLSGRVAYLRAK